MSAVRVASSDAARSFPMIEWVLVEPSAFFWRLNVELTFTEAKSASKRILALPPAADDATSVPSQCGRFVIVTFQSQSAPSARQQVDMDTNQLDGPAQAGGDSHESARRLASGDTMVYGQAVSEWKDVCRENVIAFAEALRRSLVESTSTSSSASSSLSADDADASCGWWFDVTDPATGQPLHGRVGPSLYSESDSIGQLLKLPVVPIGVGNSVCHMVQHPRHGMDVYPASLFFIGPRDLLVAALSQL